MVSDRRLPSPDRRLPHTWSRVSPSSALVDDFSAHGTSWYYNRMGGDRGTLGGSGCTAAFAPGLMTIASQSASGFCGGWTSLRNRNVDRTSLDPRRLLGELVDSAYQARLVGIDVELADGTGSFKLELKDRDNNLVWSRGVTLLGGKRSLSFPLSITSPIKTLVWVVSGKGSARLDRVAFKVSGPTLDLPLALFSYGVGQLTHCHGATHGLTGDRARWPAEHMAAVQSSGAFALVLAVAAELKVVPRARAVAEVKRIVTTLLGLPTHRGLWPHFVQWDTTAGAWRAQKSSEWSSLDTTLALMSALLACRGLGLSDLESRLEGVARAIDWAALTANGSRPISHGYSSSKSLLSSGWGVFGGESLLAALLYAGVTGKAPPLDSGRDHPPSWNGSGFIDELAHLLVATDRSDVWGNHWPTHRHRAALKQLSYFAGRYADLFGLSASEVPRPWLAAAGKTYGAWGVGGQGTAANTGESIAGFPVIAPHYAALILADHRAPADAMLRRLMVRDRRMTPLNNVESLGQDAAKGVHYNHLQGSWNLSLQTLGAARAASGSSYAPHRWTMSNKLLAKGHKIVFPAISPGGP